MNDSIVKQLLKSLFAPIERVQHELRYNPIGRRLLVEHPSAQVAKWERAGRPAPPPAPIKHNIIRTYARRFGLRVLVETGTFVGDTPDALQHDFERIYTIELDHRLATASRQRFRTQPHISVIEGDSSLVLRDLASSLHEPLLFWLDGHWSGGVTARGPEISPVLSEVTTILERTVVDDVLLIDDARLFGTPGYPTVEHIRQLILRSRSKWEYSVENDIIRAHPRRA